MDVRTNAITPPTFDSASHYIISILPSLFIVCSNTSHLLEGSGFTMYGSILYYIFHSGNIHF